MPKHQEAAVSKASAWAEAVGYVANICLSTHKLQQLNLQEQQLLKKVQQHCRVSRRLCMGLGLVNHNGLLYPNLEESYASACTRCSNSTCRSSSC
jgi:hypothetical protein